MCVTLSRHQSFTKMCERFFFVFMPTHEGLSGIHDSQMSENINRLIPATLLPLKPPHLLVGDMYCIPYSSFCLCILLHILINQYIMQNFWIWCQNCIFSIFLIFCTQLVYLLYYSSISFFPYSRLETLGIRTLKEAVYMVDAFPLEFIDDKDDGLNSLLHNLPR